MKTQYLQDMEAAIRAGCQVPGCDHKHGPANELFFHQQCHLGAGLEVVYRKGSEQLEINCRVCKKHVVTVAVALDLSRQ